MYLVQAYTLQPPAVKIESLALTRENTILLEMLMEEGTGSRDYASRASVESCVLDSKQPYNFINRRKITSTSQSISIARMLEFMSF